MPFFKKPLAGPGYIILNVIRAMNIIGLFAVIVASFSMLVKTFIVSKFFFFDAVSHVITASLSSKFTFPLPPSLLLLPLPFPNIIRLTKTPSNIQCSSS